MYKQIPHHRAQVQLRSRPPRVTLSADSLFCTLCVDGYITGSQVPHVTNEKWEEMHVQVKNITRS